MNQATYMNCEQARLMLPDHLRQELSEAVGIQLDSHLGVCSACQREWLELSTLQSDFFAGTESSTAEVAEARLGLRRVLQQSAKAPRPLLPRSMWSRAAGFLLAISLLYPVCQQWGDQLLASPSLTAAAEDLERSSSLSWQMLWDAWKPGEGLLPGMPTLDSSFMVDSPEPQ